MKKGSKFLCSILAGTILLLIPVGAKSEYHVSATAQKNKYLQTFDEKEYRNFGVDERSDIRDAINEAWKNDNALGSVLVEKTKDKKYKDLVVSLKKEDKVKVLHKIKNVYTTLDFASKSLARDFVNRQAMLTNDSALIDFKSEINHSINNKEITIAKAKGYNYSGAGKWAYDNYNKKNSGFPYFEGDYNNCANFVSQAMYLGGKKSMNSTWYIKKKNSKYKTVKNSKQLNYSWKVKDPSPWISARQFGKYWNDHATSRAVSNTNINIHPEDYLYSPGTPVVFYKGAAGVGGVATHIMIVSKKTKSKIYLAGNSKTRQKYPITDAVDSYSYVEFISPK